MMNFLAHSDVTHFLGSVGFVVIVIISVLSCAYGYYSYKFNYWKRRGINGPIPSTPLGNIVEDIKLGMRKHDLNYVNEYGKLFGVYAASKPMLVVTEPELIKEILVTQFINLSGANLNHGHKVLRKLLSNVSGPEWKKLRSILSPTFTSGKMKAMMPMIEDSCDVLEHVIQKRIKSGGIVDIKSMFENFTIEVIAKTAFATTINSQEEDTEFQVHAKGLFNFSLLKFGLMQFLPQFLNLKLQIVPMPVEHLDYLTDLCKEVIRNRKEGSFSKLREYTDFLALILETKEEITEEEILAAALLILSAGYETTASTLAYMAYSLAKYPEIQEKLIQEVDAVERVDYESILNLPYLEAVMHETLRMYPPLVRIERLALKDVTLSNGLTIEKDVGIRFPIYAIHHDPDSWPEPEQFKPERFLPENKDFLVPYSWLPFVDGPRNCVGRRFAEMEAKLCITRLLKKYKFIACSKTEPQLEFKNVAIMLSANSVTVQFVARN